MIDFLMISTRPTKRGVIEIYPKFIIKKSSDLMIRGGDFYAIWLDDIGLWSTDEQDALRCIGCLVDDVPRAVGLVDFRSQIRRRCARAHRDGAFGRRCHVDGLRPQVGDECHQHH